MEKRQPTMRKILKFLLDNKMVELTSKEISKSIKVSNISYHTSRLKAFITDNKDVSDILQVRVAKKRESVFMCKAKSIDYPEEWAEKLYNDYLTWERNQGGRVKEAIPKTLTIPKDKEAASAPISFVYKNDEPIEIPINIKLSIAIEVVNQSQK